MGGASPGVRRLLRGPSRRLHLAPVRLLPPDPQQGPRRRPALHRPSRLSCLEASEPGPAGGMGRIKGSRARRPGLLAWAGERAPSPPPTFKGRRGGEGATPRRHQTRTALSPAAPSQLVGNPRNAWGAGGVPGFRVPGCLPAKQGVNTFRRRRLPPPALPPRQLPSLPPRHLNTVRRRGAGSALPESGAGSRGEGALSFLGPHTAVTHPEEENK